MMYCIWGRRGVAAAATTIGILCTATAGIGCHADADGGRGAAQQVARNAIAQLVTYEDLVHAKVTTVNDAYERLHQDIAARRQPDAAEAARVSIATAASKAEGDFVSAGELPTGENLREFAENVIRGYRGAQVAEEANRVALEQQFGEQLLALEVDSSSLKAIRKQLEPLQADLSDQEKASRAREILKRVQVEYEKQINSKK